MKSKNVILLFLLLFSVSVSAKQNLKKYYKYMADAENFIMAEQYDKAVISYQNAFKNKDFPFGDDLENAVFCESKLQKPSIERCKYYIENGVSKGWLKNVLKMDTTLLSDFIFRTSYMYEIGDTISKMVERDQFARKVEHSTMLKVDSTNIAAYKELLKTVDLLDERIVTYSLGDLGTLFIHWLDNKDFRAFITPLMLKAVQDGRYDARLFAKQMDYAIFRDNDFSGNFLQYGTQLLKIFELEEDRSKPMKERKYFAYFNFNKNNPNDVKTIREIDKNRAEIYLDGIIECAVREFKLHFTTILRVPAISISGRKKDLSLLQKEIDKNPNLIYYISNKHDFNSK